MKGQSYNKAQNSFYLEILSGKYLLGTTISESSNYAHTYILSMNQTEKLYHKKYTSKLDLF